MSAMSYNGAAIIGALFVLVFFLVFFFFPFSVVVSLRRRNALLLFYVFFFVMRSRCVIIGRSLTKTTTLSLCVRVCSPRLCRVYIR
jgi:hypothetical protein